MDILLFEKESKKLYLKVRMSKYHMMHKNKYIYIQIQSHAWTDSMIMIALVLITVLPVSWRLLVPLYPIILHIGIIHLKLLGMLIVWTNQ